MGIKGLIQNLQPILVSSSSCNNIEPKATVPGKHNIREFSNSSIAIDVSSWLFKAGYSIAESLTEAAEQVRVDWQLQHPQIVQSLSDYVGKRCNELFKFAGIGKITLVFDGTLRCPLKAKTNDSRNTKRAITLQKARQFKNQGKPQEAAKRYLACVQVPFELAVTVAKSVMARRIPRVSCIVAPFEADAQLAKLCVEGTCQAVVTEDSDLLVYSAAIGVPFPIIFKLDRKSGSCDVMDMSWLFPSSTIAFDKENKVPFFNESGSTTLQKGSKFSQYLQSFQLKEKKTPGYGRRLFVQACVLAGCDYTINSPLSLVGIGLITAFKLINSQSHRSHQERFAHVLSEWKGSGSNSIVCEARSHTKVADLKDYEELLAMSETVFYHHFVHCKRNNSVLPLQPLQSASVSSLGNYGEDNFQHVYAEERIHMPTVCRFKDCVTFLGTTVTTDCYKSQMIGFKSMKKSASKTNAWISKKSAFFTPSSKKDETRKSTKKETERGHRDIRSCLQVINPKQNIQPVSNAQTHHVKLLEEEEGSEADGTDALVAMLKEDRDSAKIARNDSSSLVSRFSPKMCQPESSRTSKQSFSTIPQHQNRFLVFAYHSQEYPSSLSAERHKAGKSKVLDKNVAQTQGGCTTTFTPGKKFDDDDDSVPSSVPPKLFLEVECTVLKTFKSPLLERKNINCESCMLHGVNTDKSIYDFDEAEEVELTSMLPFSNSRRVSVEPPDQDDDSIHSLSPFAPQKSSAPVNSLVTNRICSTKSAVVDGTSWSDNESDCSIADSEYMPAHFTRFSFENSTTGRSHQKRNNFSTASPRKKTKINGSDYGSAREREGPLILNKSRNFQHRMSKKRETNDSTKNDIK